jgi:MioC protein
MRSSAPRRRRKGLATIKILVGTMTGTAELVAEEICDQFVDLGHEVDVVPMDGLDAAVFAPGATYLVCVSTYGQGDVPDNALGVFDDLEAGRPDLSALAYGMISLGDRTYADTYCHGGTRFDTLLGELGARRVGSTMEHDASDGTIPEEVALEWSREWINLIDDQEQAA